MQESGTCYIWRTGNADHGIPLKGRSSQSLEQVQVHRVQIQNYASDFKLKSL